MLYEELPDNMKEFLDGLKHGSSTIECDVQDALDKAENIDEFMANVSNAMNDLIGEAEAVKIIFGKELVHVVIHLHRGVIFNMAAYRDPKKAKEEYEKAVIEAYGELVEDQQGDDWIDLQECQVITEQT